MTLFMCEACTLEWATDPDAANVVGYCPYCGSDGHVSRVDFGDNTKSGDV